MSCLLLPDDHEVDDERINIDDLYSKKQAQDLKQLSIFNKILNRIHTRIKTTAKKQVKEKFVWFLVPQFIFGSPLYDQGECVGYVVHKLELNGFQCRYIHPNALYISWAHWVPFYVRDEYKRKTGISIDEYGNVQQPTAASASLNTMMMSGGGGSSSSGAGSAASAATEPNSNSKYAVAKGYKPQNIIYHEDLFQTMSKKFA